jgi:hypothetical protein
MFQGAKYVVVKEPIHQALVEYTGKQLQSAFHECNGAAVLK